MIICPFCEGTRFMIDVKLEDIGIYVIDTAVEGKGPLGKFKSLDGEVVTRIDDVIYCADCESIIEDDFVNELFDEEVIY